MKPTNTVIKFTAPRSMWRELRRIAVEESWRRKAVVPMAEILREIVKEFISKRVDRRK